MLVSPGRPEPRTRVAEPIEAMVAEEDSLLSLGEVSPLLQLALLQSKVSTALAWRSEVCPPAWPCAPLLPKTKSEG